MSALDAAKAFAFSNFGAIKAHNTTKEAFGEILVPLVRDVPLLRSLEFNGAARVTNDATGTIWSWKLGLQDEVVDGVRLHATLSRDIRAPSLSDLYRAGAASLLNLNDPPIGTYFIPALINGGNANLETEASRTKTVGVTIAPAAVPRLNASLVYYDINIKNGIAAVSAQDIILRCSNGQTLFCGNITRGSDGRISQVVSNLLNFAHIHTSGVDAHLDYSIPVGDSSIGITSDFAYTQRYIVDDRIVRTSFVNTPITASGGSIGGIPRYRANTTIAWNGPDVRTYVRWRYLSRQYYNKSLDIAGNRIPAYNYFDLGFAVPVQFASTKEFEFYGNVVNIFDRDPPKSYHFSAVYDLVGTYFSAGVRVRF